MSGLKLNSRERIQTMAEFKMRFCQATGVTEPEPARKISATRDVMGNDAILEPGRPDGRSGRWRYIAAILIEATVFTLVPAAFLATIAPLHGLLMGIGLMLAVNLLLSRESPWLTFGQRILGMNDLPPLVRLFAYNLMRCILPWSLLDEGVALTGLTKLSFVERRFRQTAVEESLGTTGLAPDTPGTSAARQTAWLMCCAQSRRGERIRLAKSQSLGCDETRCDVVLSHTDRMVSHCHCNIYYSGVSSQAVSWYISDNNSTNGTFVNGNRLPKNAESVLLADGDRLTIGSEDYIFRVE